MSKQENIRDHIKVAPTENLIIWMIYQVAVPIARAALFLRISPNTLTTLSSAFAISSGITLLIDGLHDAFIPLFIISLLLDFTDGLVARTSGKIGRTAFRYDHISDLFKVSFVVLCLAIYCNSILVWILSMSSITLFLVSTVLNHEMDSARKTKNYEPQQGFDRIRFLGNPIVTNIFAIFFTYNSHSLLLFIFITRSPEFAPHVFAYLIIISTYACMRYINILMKLEH